MVRDVAAARAGFGPYIDPVSVDIGSASGLGRAVRSVRSVAAIGRLGALPAAAKKAGVQRLVLLSSAGVAGDKCMRVGAWHESGDKDVCASAAQRPQVRLLGLGPTRQWRPTPGPAPLCRTLQLP